VSGAPQPQTKALDLRVLAVPMWSAHGDDDDGGGGGDTSLATAQSALLHFSGEEEDPVSHPLPHPQHSAAGAWPESNGHSVIHSKQPAVLCGSRHDSYIERHDSYVERHDSYIERHDPVLCDLLVLRGYTGVMSLCDSALSHVSLFRYCAACLSCGGPTPRIR
jgi:hypothetical protein